MEMEERELGELESASDEVVFEGDGVRLLDLRCRRGSSTSGSSDGTTNNNALTNANTTTAASHNALNNDADNLVMKM
jgi:hypothetical protein